MLHDYRDESRRSWGPINGAKLSSLEELNTGALLRIADAAEKMAVSYSQLIAERDKYKRMCEYVRKRADRAERSRDALRGALARAKKARK